MSEELQETHTRQGEAPEQIDIVRLLRSLVRGVRRTWWLMPIFAVLAGAAMGLRAVRSYTPMYKSEASFTVGVADSSGNSYSFYYNSSTAEQMAATFPYILESDLLTDLVKEELGVSYINGSISASSVAETNLFTLTVYSTSAQDACDILNAVIEHYNDISDYVIGKTQLNMIESPVVADEPYNTPGAKSSAAKGVAAGIVAALIIELLYGLTRRTICSEKEIKDVLNVRSLGEIPQITFKKHKNIQERQITISDRKIPDEYSENMRSLTLKLETEFKKQGKKVIAVTSAQTGEGVSTTAANMALALAETGRKVLLIKAAGPADASAGAGVSVRDRAGKNKAHKKDDEKTFSAANEEDNEVPSGVNAAEMFKAYIKGSAGLEELIRPDTANGIYVLDMGRAVFEKEMLMRSVRIGAMISECRAEMDYVIIDTPACSGLSRAALFVRYSDAVVFVIKHDKLPVRVISDAIEEISCYGASFAGCILNGAQISGRAGYGYGYGYRYGRYGSRYGRYGYGGHYGRYGYGRYGYGRYGYGKSGYGKYGYGYGSHYGADEEENSGE